MVDMQNVEQRHTVHFSKSGWGRKEKWGMPDTTDKTHE